MEWCTDFGMGIRNIRWVSEENLHLSLAFLGDITEAQSESLHPALDEAAIGVDPFTITVRAAGCFGSMRSPRVLWAGVEAEGGLERLQLKVAEAVRKSGIEMENRSYMPHITLGRLRKACCPQDIGFFIKSLHERIAGQMIVDQFVFMTSTLQPAGAQYEIHYAVKLGEIVR
jgi:2'-5' RNA ligase